ncbi:MAG: hypothetical protein OWQ50_07445 [Acidianus infernus]|nr:hypothetical protein [Acidianus infernus]
MRSSFSQLLCYADVILEFIENEEYSLLKDEADRKELVFAGKDVIGRI